MKKVYDDETIKQMIEFYLNNVNLSKIRSILKVKKNNIKQILIEKNIWVEGRDNIKKVFNENEINDILFKYTNENLGCEKIAKHYNVSKNPINKILKEKGLLKDGVSDGKKIKLADEQLIYIKKLYLEEYKSTEEISKIMNLGKPFINKVIHKSGYRRNRGEGTSVSLIKKYRNISYDEYLKSLSEFKKYKKKVISVTKKQPISNLSNFNKRGVSGVDGNYHLDHKFSIVEGFNQNIDPCVIGNIKNLEFIPWQENVKKRTKCSIKITELIN